MPSLTEENYLKAIYNLCQSTDKKASTNEIAKRMETKASSVTDMLKRLNDKKLVNYKKYQAVKLTDEGQQVAVSIIRKHRLWEYFLVENLDFGWDEVHDVAEQLEHIQSVKLTNQLEEFLDYPKYDPHGDPIPNRKGEFPTRKTETLADCTKNEIVKITGVKDHSSSFLNYLSQLKIELGTELNIIAINDFDYSFTVKSSKNEQHTLSEKVTKNLYIKTL